MSFSGRGSVAETVVALADVERELAANAEALNGHTFCWEVRRADKRAASQPETVDQLAWALAAYKRLHGERALKDFLRGYLGCVLY